MRFLVCGSLAFDHVMLFSGHFKEQIIPEATQFINLSFLIDTMRRSYGGCAGNIAYNLKLLGSDVEIMATVGNDFSDYQKRLEQLNIFTTKIKKIEKSYTAQAFIITDLADNQITAFHPGAMQHAHENSIGDIENIDLAILAPDGKEGTLLHAQQCSDLQIPFIWDPGQGLPMFDRTELQMLLRLATWLIVNDYEWQLLKKKIDLSEQTIISQCTAVIVTHGGKGSVIHAKDAIHRIAAVKTDKVVDPTGCGDAYRAGIMHGISHKLTWPVTGKIASLLGAIKVESDGGQNHNVSSGDIKQRFYQQFGHHFDAVS